MLNCSHETSVQKAIKKALQIVGIHKPVGPHAQRQSFTIQLLVGGTDIRTIQDLLGYKYLITTMFYTHVANLAAVQSSLDVFVSVLNAPSSYNPGIKHTMIVESWVGRHKKPHHPIA